ncbi:MAG: hypothetical protein HOQ02_11490 [Lysobacter sp.]|nr:hypothetical protein [Lysobacter sp.]
MKLHPLRSLMLAALLSCAIAPAFADDVADTTVPEILHTQHALREKLDNPTGEYSRFDADALTRMRQAQDKVFGMLNGVTSLDQLTVDRKIELSNALSQIKATLLANEGSRMICHRERKTGTNLLERRCETVAERDARAHDAQIMMNHDGIGR